MKVSIKINKRMPTQQNLYTQQSSNNTKTFFLMMAFIGLIFGIGYFLSYYYGNPFILWFALGGALLMNFMSYWFSDKVVLKLAHAREATREEYFDLYTIVENLSITAGLPMPKVYVMDDAVPNAFATGRNKDHAVVVFSTGLLAILEKPELEGVAAHELAHIGNKDILLQTVVVTLVGTIGLIADFFLRMTMFGGRGNDRNGNAIVLVIGVALMILMPIIATLLKLAISRKREFAADATGALLSRYPEGLASALEKIEQYSGTMKHANHATAHLYISNPFNMKKDKESFLNKIFRTHPPTHERIAALRGVEIK